MRIIKPTALRRGDVIGICAPASAPDSEDILARGISYLERIGYRVELARHINRRRGYLAGSDAHRAADLNDLFANRAVKAIFAARGGYGSHRILPFINYALIRRHPKIFVGYSDITALQMALLARSGLVTFSGPMVTSEMASGLGGKSEERLWATLTSSRVPPPFQCYVDSRRGKRMESSTGRTLGGNLSVLVSMIGTPYFPDITRPILFLEEIDERPYRIDRMLQQMRFGGILRRSRGIVLGQFIDCKPAPGKHSLTLRQVFDDTLGEYRFPLLTGLLHGHMRRSLTIPVGVRVRLSCISGTMDLLESAVA